MLPGRSIRAGDATTFPAQFRHSAKAPLSYFEFNVHVAAG
jgi:hypothetical protein